MNISQSIYRGDNRFAKWDKDFKKAYPHIMSDTVIAYAQAVREYGALIEFCPLIYLENEEYRRKMDENAQALLEALNDAREQKGKSFDEQNDAIIKYSRLCRSLWGRYVLGVGYVDDDDDGRIRERKRNIEKEEEIER